VLDIMTGAPKQIKIGSDERSRTVMVGPLKLTEFGILQRWIREHGEPPLVRLEEELKVAPEEEHRKLRYEAWREQRDDWPPAPYTMKGAKILFATAEGIRFFLEIFLRKHNPSVTDDEITFYMACMGMAELDTMATIAFGADDLDPKQVWERAMEMRWSRPNSIASSPPDSEPPRDSAGPGGSISTPLTSSLHTNSPTNSPS
jgi:hypothetical protein